MCTSLSCILYFLWHKFLVDSLTFVTDDVLTTAYFFAKLEKMSRYFWCKCVYIYLKWNECRGNIHCLFSVFIAMYLLGNYKMVEKHTWPWASQQPWGQTQHFHCHSFQPILRFFQVGWWKTNADSCAQPGASLELRRHCSPYALLGDENRSTWWIINTKVTKDLEITLKTSHIPNNIMGNYVSVWAHVPEEK